MANVQDAEISIFVPQGELTPAQFLMAYGEFLTRGSTRLVLWDLTSANMAEVTADEVRDLARCLAQITRERPDDGKTAITCRTILNFGVAHAVATFLPIEGFPGKVDVFSNPEAARAWLTEEGAAP